MKDFFSKTILIYCLMLSLADAIEQLCQLRVVEPKILFAQISSWNQNDGFKERGLLESKLASFGKRHGEELVAKLIYPPNNRDACQPFVWETMNFTGEEKQIMDQEKFIIMVDRGQCPFTQKARNVQLLKANMMIVANNEPLTNITGTVMSDGG